MRRLTIVFAIILVTTVLTAAPGFAMQPPGGSRPKSTSVASTVRTRPSPDIPVLQAWWMPHRGSHS